MGDESNERRLLVLYGSQTGTAQSVAERIGRESKRFHFRSEVTSMDDYDIRKLIQALVVYIAATTGQGDVPDNMKRFWKFLLRKNLPNTSLTSMMFGVLALGDSSYQKFNFCGKRLQRRLEQLGAHPVLPIGLADDQHDLGPDAVIDPWLDNLWTKLIELRPLPFGVEPLPAACLLPPKYKVILGSSSKEMINPPQIAADDSVVNDSSCPFLAPLIRCERVTSIDHFQDTRLVEFDISNSNITFAPGDVCMIQPANLNDRVERFVRLFSHFDVDADFELRPNDADTKLPPFSALPSRLTLRNCAKTLFDLQAIPGRYFFELLSHFTDDSTEKEKFIEFTTAAGQQDLYEYCNRPRRNILEVLEDFQLHTVPHIPLEYLFEIFPVIKPRAFSIASSLASHPSRIQLLIAVVQYKSKLMEPRKGLCSNWLTTLNPGDRVPIWIKKGTFKFPLGKTPVVMVGPGTGVAPFRSYISHQLSLPEQKSQPLLLFFGCRHPEKDYYFQDEWRKAEEECANLMVRTAFSRLDGEDDDAQNGPYVQHVIAKHSQDLVNFIVKQNGIFYIAGRAKQMPDQVRQALKDSLINNANFPETEAEKFIQKMEQENRYQTETWS